MVLRYFGHVDWVLNSFEKLLFYEMDYEICVKIMVKEYDH